MPWASRRLTTNELSEVIAQEAARRNVTRREMIRQAHGAHGIDLPGGQLLIHDGAYFLLTPTEAR